MVVLPGGEKILKICVTVYSIPACNGRTDRQTDRRTSCDGIVHAMHTRRAVKTIHSYNERRIETQYGAISNDLE